jgi:diamine N-acetyltransferase
MNNKLIGKILELRALEPEDLEILYKWENDTEIWDLSNRVTPLSKYILKKYLESAHQDIYETKQLRLVIQVGEDSRPIGAIDLFDFDPFHRRAGIGILIAEKSDRRRGYAREALELLIDYAYDTLDLHQLFCHVSHGNKPSQDLFMQAGFEITGSRLDWIWNGERFEDEHFYQLIRKTQAEKDRALSAQQKT